jgi:hypothetical protein
VPAADAISPPRPREIIVEVEVAGAGDVASSKSLAAEVWVTQAMAAVKDQCADGDGIYQHDYSGGRADSGRRMTST